MPGSWKHYRCSHRSTDRSKEGVIAPITIVVFPYGLYINIKYTIRTPKKAYANYEGPCVKPDSRSLTAGPRSARGLIATLGRGRTATPEGARGRGAPGIFAFDPRAEGAQEVVWRWGANT